ncbi:MAG: T9SS type A sorting domain-containing protein, partial [Fibrobacteres bacterium]|nr:T9SS type A sorting domain-containing protein [Fibrobacterota bacterium]
KYKRYTSKNSIEQPDSFYLTFRYDLQNKLTETEELNYSSFPVWGTVLTKKVFAYDANGKVASITNFEQGLTGMLLKGRTLFERTDSTLIETVLFGTTEAYLNDRTLSEMSRTVRKFNSKGLLIQLRLEDKNNITGWRTSYVTDYTYDAANRLLSISFDGRVTDIVYDAKGRIDYCADRGNFGSKIVNTYLTSTSCESPQQNAETGCISASPNPFNPSTSIKFSLTNAGKVKCAILDAQGRLVRNLANGQLNAGSHALRWDGRNEKGKAVPSNMYFAVLTTPQGTTKTRLLLLK